MNPMNNVAETEQNVDNKFFQMLTLATLIHDSTMLKSLTKDLIHNDVSSIFCAEINQSILSLHIIFREERAVSSAFCVLNSAVQVLEWAFVSSATWEVQYTCANVKMLPKRKHTRLASLWLADTNNTVSMWDYSKAALQSIKWTFCGGTTAWAEHPRGKQSSSASRECIWACICLQVKQSQASTCTNLSPLLSPSHSFDLVHSICFFCWRKKTHFHQTPPLQATTKHYLHTILRNISQCLSPIPSNCLCTHETKYHWKSIACNVWII